MILEKQKDSIILEMGDDNESLDMSLDLDSAQILMQMLSKNLYSDAIGSTIRETCSNALDSHRKANVSDPIVVSFKQNNDNTYSFTVEDFGTGLDDNDVANIISKYGKSTKRQDANALGMMGLGFKAPLAYSSSFYFICRKNGMEWKYMMYEGEDSNKIDLLYAQHTTERNGVKIIIPVKYSDKIEFQSKIREQLAYFESVYFDTGNVSNDFEIIRTTHYQVSQLTSTSYMHICLDNVYYPIDFDKLGIPQINVPVGLRFSLSDGIFPTPNRESIRYTVESKRIIMEKIKKVAEVLINMFNDSITDTSDIKVVFNYYGSYSRNVSIGNKLYNVIPLLKYTTVTLAVPKLIGVDILDLKHIYSHQSILLREYEVRYRIKIGKMSETKLRDNREISPTDVDDTHYFLYNDPIGGRKRDYLRDQCTYSTFHICKKITNYELGFRCRRSILDSVIKFSYYHVLNLQKYPKAQWRQIIKEFQFVQNIYLDKFKNIDNIIIPQEWLDARKRVKLTGDGSGKRIKLEGELFGKLASPLERYVTGQSCKFVSDTFKVADIPRYKGLTVYDSYDNQNKLDMLYYISKRTNNKLRMVSFSNREMKIVGNLNIHNLISFEQFMKGDNKVFRRLITAYLINELMEEYSHTFSKKSYLKTISLPLFDKLVALEQYKKENFLYGDSKIYESMLPVANQYMLFDMKIYIEYTDIKYLFKRLTFLEPVMKTLSTYNNDDMVPVLVDLFKYYKHRIDYQNYKVPLNETLDLDALLLIDQTIEELTKV